MICREWVWKGLPLGAGQGSDPGFMRTHTKVGWDCIAEPYVDVVRKVWLLGFSPRRLTFSPFFLPFSFFGGPPLLTCSLSLLYQYLPPVLHLRVSFSWFGVFTRPINPYVRVVGKNWIAWCGVWARQALGSTLWCWQLSRLYCSCTEFVLFPQTFCEVLSVRSSSATFLGR